jgi:DNA replication protein DnaC
MTATSAADIAVLSTFGFGTNRNHSKATTAIDHSLIWTNGIQNDQLSFVVSRCRHNRSLLGILVVGGPGSGKTHFISMVIDNLKDFNPIYLQCADLLLKVRMIL